jgi:Ca2+-binding EF-hand superfamily protein
MAGIEPEDVYPGEENAGMRETFRAAIVKLDDCGAHFNGERDRHFLKNFRGNRIDPEEFRDQLRRSINCRLSADEMRALVPLMDNTGEGLCDGALFLILFYRLRHEQRNKLLTNRIAAEKKTKRKIAERLTRRQRVFESFAEVEVPEEFTEEERVSAMAKISFAAARYDRLMPGTVQLDAFEGQVMTPALFREQLKSVFNMRISLGELAALMQYFDSDGDGFINCAEFLIHFFRAGFAERTRQMEEERQQKLDFENAAKRKKEEEDIAKASKNSLKVDYIYDKESKDRAYKKLRAAAMLYDKNGCGAVNMSAFEGAFMEPYVFKEQLRRVFNLQVSPKELGALMDLFDHDGDGTINCTEFTLIFARMGAEERDTANKNQREKQRKDTERRVKAEEEFQAEQAKRNASLVDYDFGEDDYTSAMEKLTEAAWRYDSTMPGAPSVAGFRCKSQKPHEFKEQLKRVFNLNTDPKELGALITYFDKGEIHEIDCADFLIEFVRLGSEERSRQKKEYLKYQKSKELQRKMRAEMREKEAEMKNNLKLENEFSEDDFNSAMKKMTTAAFYYDRSSPGAVQLDAFDAEAMLPHIFKEQLKRTLNLKVTPKELGALMSYFDPQGVGSVKCSEFLIEFFRLGFEQRNKLRTEFRIMKKERTEKDKKMREDMLLANQKRGEAAVDFEFLEADFDSALFKLIDTCHRFDQRQLGPAGWRAFQTDKLTASEYRELMKQTFDMRISPQELGALVTYFDVDFSGMVSCSAFLNSFTQIRVNLEPHKVNLYT